MPAAQFPASAATSLIDGYCDDFSAFAAVLSQTLEQVSSRKLEIGESRTSLVDLERHMRELTATVHAMLGDSAPEAAAGATADPAHSPPRPEHTAAKNTAQTSQQARAAAQKPRLLTPRSDAPPTVSLKGNNETMPLLSVCQFLGRMRKNGVMHVAILAEELTFEFMNGCIQYTSSTGCPANERTGEILVAMGFCDETELAPIFAQVAQSDELLGNLILESKLVSHGQLLEALERQVQLRFARACKTVMANYWFDEGTCSPTDGRVHITPLELAWQQKTDSR